VTDNRQRQQSEIDIIDRFTQVFCRKNHGTAEELCDACQELRDYAVSRLMKCPYDPKPPCKQCPNHCFEADMRLRIKEVMRFSGMYYVKRGRLDWLVRYFLINRTMSRNELNKIKKTE